MVTRQSHNSLSVQATMFLDERERGRGGGVLILVRDDVVVQEVENAIWRDVEVVSCELKFGSVMKIACIYRPPNADPLQNEMIRETVQKLGSSKGQVLICGDFNFPQINWVENTVKGGEMSEQSKFLDSCQDVFMHQNVRDFTRVRGNDEPSLLDLILTKHPLEVENLQHKAPIGSSDHCVLAFDMLIDRTESRQENEWKRNFFKGNYVEAARMFDAVNWEKEFQDKNVQRAWDVFLDHYNTVIDKCIPLNKSKKGRNGNKKWMTRDVMAAIHRKEEAWLRYRKKRNKVRMSEYKKLRNKATQSIRKAKYQFEVDLAKDVKSNPKAFYAYARSKTSIKEELISVKNDQGILSGSLEEACETMNEKFAKVFLVTDQLSPPVIQSHQGNKLTSMDISVEEVESTLRELKTSAPGPDGVHPVVLRNCSQCLSKPLVWLFKKSLMEGCVPRDWKQANITPIFKKGCRSDALNYRPISLTSVVCKVMERQVRKHLIKHLEDSNLLSKHQHGFRSGMSCLTQLLEYLTEIGNVVDNGEDIDSIYLDCSKAFDTVPHRHLLAKLCAIGIEGHVLKWIESFLTGREQRVGIRGTFSSWRKVKSGVPQGSVMGPTLFLVYINDLLDGLQSKGKLFADDVKIYATIRGIEDSHQLQSDLNRLEEWSKKWLLKFNGEKCKVMSFGARNPKHDYTLDGAKLTHSDQEKDLGVLVTTDLKPSAQVSRAAACANSMLGRLRATFTCLNEITLPLLYKALVRPRMEFAIQAWSPYLKKDIEKLEKVQRRATKLIPTLAHLPYHDRLKHLGLTTLEERRNRGDMIETFKIIHGYDKVEVNGPFLQLDKNHQQTRGHSLKLVKPRHRTHKRNCFFPARVISAWNDLPGKVVESENVNTFKRRYDCHMMNKH